MDAKTFFNAWCEVTDVEKNKLLSPKQYWYNRANKTALMEHEIYPKLADALFLKVATPYYFIDAVFYTKEDRTPDIPEHTTFLRKIKIGLEHENIFDRSLYQELSHLLLISCNLRVIVSYPNGDQPEEILKYLSYIITTHGSLDVKDRSILLILGTRGGNGGGNDDIYWEGYVFEDKSWKSDRMIHLIGELQEG